MKTTFFIQKVKEAKVKIVISVILIGAICFTTLVGSALASEQPVAADVWLLFGIDQQAITGQTTKLTGSIGMQCNDTVIKVYVNGKSIAEKNLPNNCDPFSIDVDFSRCQIGDVVIVSREFAGKIESTSGSGLAIHNQSRTFIIGNACVTSSTPAPTSETNLKITPEPKVEKSTSETPVVAADTWLLFGIDQQTITAQTTKLTGNIGIQCSDTVIRVYVNGKIVAEKNLPNNCDPFSIDVDFSSCKTGDVIVVGREFVGKIENTLSNSLAIHNQSQTFTIMDKLISNASYEKSAKIKLSKNQVTLKKGKKIKLKAEIFSNEKNIKLRWSSDSKKIALLNKGSKFVTIKALKNGKTVVTAKLSSGKTAKCVIKVIN